MNDFLNYNFLNNPLKDWGISLLIIVGIFLVVQLVKSTVLKKLTRWAQQTKGTMDDFLVLQIDKTIFPFLKLLSVYFGLSFLTFGPKVEHWLTVVLMLIATFLGLKIITAGIKFFVNRSLQGQENIEVKMKQARGVLIIINVLIWFTGIIFFLSNLGYNVTSIIAGLGIGGIAIALAAQAILGDLFSYFVIFFDKPFEIGDYILVGDKSGIVEYVGLKTTRLRTLAGEQLIFPNHDLTNSRVHNYKRMEKRRIVFSTGVTYDTTADKLASIPQILKDIITSLPDITFDRCHFSAFGDFSLNFETVYFVNTADFLLYKDSQEKINLALIRRFGSEGIEFAFPTQTVILQGSGKNPTFKTVSLHDDKG